MSKFTTKKYTRPVLRKELKSLSVANFVSTKELAYALSPVKGSRSAKFSALRNSLPVSLKQVFEGTFSASERKFALINFLKN